MIAALMQRVSEPEQDPLLQLYWNRAGVKRELVKLKREHYDLLEKMEQQAGAIVRAQSQLEGLERLLTNPVAAANAMVYFQLRHMWRVAALKVEQFARELKQQRESRERTQLHNTILAKRQRRLEAINLKVGELLTKRKAAIDECVRLEQTLERMNVVVRLFRGRAISGRIQAMMTNRHALDERVEEFNEIVEKIQGEPLPETDGLSLESRRFINVAVLALAQHLVVHFAEHDLARLARKAVKRPVGDMKFGDRRTCDHMVERIRGRIDDLNQDRKLADKVMQRTDMLADKVSYRHESDTTPEFSSINSIARVLPGDRRDGQRRADDAPLSVNVLEDDYWDLVGALY
jgi:hypothetical protein